MAQEQKGERSFELRSEKVRSIVGQIPSALLRYGGVVIGGVLMCLFCVAYNLPYRQVYFGVATTRDSVIQRCTDSVEMLVLLRFEGKRLEKAEGQLIFLSEGGQRVAGGQLMGLSPLRDTLERQEALCRLSVADSHTLEGRSVDFRINVSSGTILSQMLGRFLPVP